MAALQLPTNGILPSYLLSHPIAIVTMMATLSRTITRIMANGENPQDATATGFKTHPVASYSATTARKILCEINQCIKPEITIAGSAIL